MDWQEWWASLGGYFWTLFVEKLIPILIIVAVIVLIRWLLHYVIKAVVDRIVSGAKKTGNVQDTQALSASPLAAVRVVQRSRTIGSVISNVLNITLIIIAVLLIINVIDTGILGSFALLAAAVGAGLGFGAQNIVKDTMNGLFMVMEDQLGVGDIVDLGTVTGIVESVRIRITKVRDANGTLWFVRNGEILRVGNMSQGWSRIVIDVAVPYSSDIDAVQSIIRTAALSLLDQPQWQSLLLDQPEVWGLESVSETAVIVRLTAKTRNSAKDDVARELRRRLKDAFDEHEITLPSLNSVTLTDYETSTAATRASAVPAVRTPRPDRTWTNRPSAAIPSPAPPSAADPADPPTQQGE